jgi:predicted MPP superfamily phosphohydrolase
MIVSSLDLKIEPVACKITRNKIKSLPRLHSDNMIRLIAIGDIHGAYNGMLLNFYQSGITVSKSSCEWRNQSTPTVLVQTGDVVDRGPGVFEAFKCLRKLQSEAAFYNSKVVRLLGSELSRKSPI